MKIKVFYLLMMLFCFTILVSCEAEQLNSDYESQNERAIDKRDIEEPDDRRD